MYRKITKKNYINIQNSIFTKIVVNIDICIFLMLTNDNFFKKFFCHNRVKPGKKASILIFVTLAHNLTTV